MSNNIVCFPANHKSPSARAGSAQELQPVSDQALNQAVLLELLGAEPIAFNRLYVDIAGGVLPALWLTHAVKRARAITTREDVSDDLDFRFTMSARECEEEIGITRAQQVTCRRRLVELGLLTEEPSRKTSRYRLHMAELRRRTLEHIRPLATTIDRMQRSA